MVRITRFAFITCAAALLLALDIVHVNGAEFYFDGDDATIVFGTAGNTTLSRSAGGGLQTSGALQIGGTLTTAGATVKGALTVYGSAAFTDATVSDTLNVTNRLMLTSVSATSVGVSGGLVVNGTSSLGAVLATGVTVAATGGSTLLGTTTCGSSGAPGAFTAWGTAQLKSSVQIGGTLSVTGAATLSSTLTVTGTTTLSALSVSGLTSLAGTLSASLSPMLTAVSASTQLYVANRLTVDTVSFQSGAYVTEIMIRTDTGPAVYVPAPGWSVLPFSNAFISRGRITVGDSNRKFYAYLSGIYEVCAQALWYAVNPAGSDAQLFLMTSAGEVVWVTPQNDAGTFMRTCGDVYIGSGDWISVAAYIGTVDASIQATGRHMSIRLKSRHEATQHELQAMEAERARYADPTIRPTHYRVPDDMDVNAAAELAFRAHQRSSGQTLIADADAENRLP